MIAYIIKIKLMENKNKTLLFADDSASDHGEDKDLLGKNENFASKYEHNAQRNMMLSGKHNFTEKELDGGQNPDDFSSSSSDCEDSEGDLIGGKSKNKCLNIVQAIRQKNPKLKDVKEG